MKKILSLILAIVILGTFVSVPITANAASVNDLTFALKKDGKSYYVKDCSGSAWGEIVIPSTYKGLPVTAIGTSAFLECNALTGVTIPNSITSIGEYAFVKCVSLVSLTIPGSVKSMAKGAFQFCESLEKVTISSGVSSISEYNFAGCISLKTITIPSSVKSIGEYAFADCKALKTVKLPLAVTDIGANAFSGCSALKSIVIPNSVKSIGLEAFDDCKALTSITIPGSVTSIGDKAFGYYYEHPEDRFNGQTQIQKNKNLGIYGVKGSKAEKYAKDNGFKFTELKSIATPTVKVANSVKGVNVTWNPTAHAEKYVVYQKAYNAKTKKWSSWKALKTTTAESYVDTTVKLGESYNYTVKAIFGNIKSGIKSSSTIKYNATPAVKVTNASNGIKVTWSKVANATGYTVFSSTYNSKTKKWSGWKNRGTAGKDKTAWVDKTAKAGATCRYTVRAKYGSTLSSYKSSASLVRLVNPTVKAAITSDGIKVTWNKIAGAKNYKVYRAEYVNGKLSSWKGLKTTDNKTFAFVDKTAKTGVTYKYTVRAVNGSNTSAYTASGNVKR
ncbi:MAG: leucine-rich repeat protein [Clostridia bacterium]|nr:leucine-rich repeat protein [Clostridia bacterium]